MTSSWEDEVLATWRAGQRISAVGPGDVAVHLEQAQRLAPFVDPGTGRGLDLGTGAGIPGLALAGIYDQARWDLVDAAARRLRVVQAGIDRLGWAPRVQAVHARVENLGRTDAEDEAELATVVVSRLFGPLSVTLECAAPLCELGGRIVVSLPPEANVDAPPDGLTSLGLGVPAVHVAPSVAVFEKVGAAEDRFPRKSGVARKRPLW